ncbi:MAG: restriction endonuclease [Saprospiraceae bacterium]|nr:restriction endonuclease [Saprospiraceae bacterium]
MIPIKGEIEFSDKHIGSMSKKVSTNFQEVNLDHYLYSSIPIRFQGVDPSEFEDFIAYLFDRNGYDQIQTSYSADFGADVIVKKEGIKTAVQVKRYFELHKVGVSDINQVIGAQQYYQCDQALMITTSSYTPAAKQLAATAGVILWDWERLEKAISDTFLEGQHHHDYFKAFPVDISATESDIFKLQIMDIDLPGEGVAKLSGKITLRLTNLKEGHQKVSCDLPIIITNQRLQITAVKFAEESFNSGIVYGNATVEIIAEFSARQFTDYNRKDRLLLPVHLLQSQEYLVLEQKLGQVKKECFLVTFYFGRDSQEYSQMIYFRDKVLYRFALGRYFVASYYRLGSLMVRYLEDKPKVIMLLRPAVRTIVSAITRIK